MDLYSFHGSWAPILNKLYQEPLNTFLKETIYTRGVREDKTTLFKIFSKPLSAIKMVIVTESVIDLKEASVINSMLDTDFNRQEWKEQGVFFLPTSLTSSYGGDNDEPYWKDFIDTVIKYISQENPCIWMFWGTSHKLHNVKKDYILVNNYSRELIEDIPINSDWNYTFISPAILSKDFVKGDYFYKANKVLNKLNKQIKF
jgi:uracil DNA glycosylase